MPDMDVRAGVLAAAEAHHAVREAALSAGGPASVSFAFAYAHAAPGPAVRRAVPSRLTRRARSDHETAVYATCLFEREVICATRADPAAGMDSLVLVRRQYREQLTQAGIYDAGEGREDAQNGAPSDRRSFQRPHD